MESGKPGSFTLNLIGTAPEFAFSYIPQGGNVTLIGQGGKIIYPVTSIDSTSSSVFVLTNRGKQHQRGKHRRQQHLDAQRIARGSDVHRSE